MRVCAWKECGLSFTPKTHNQRYHSDDCCRQATNARLMEQYYEKKARRQGNVRVCETEGCHTRLSRYNDDKICGKCQAGKKSAARDELLAMIK